MRGDLILAIDAGTSSTRATLFDATGVRLAHASRPFSVALQASFAEADPTSLWAAVVETVRDLRVDGARIAAIGVTAAIGMVLTDAHGLPLAHICTWQDRRATREAALIENRLGAATVYGISGRRIAPELTGPLLLWFRDHRANVFAKARLMLTMKDWLLMRLCGEAVCDPAGASYSLLFDVGRGAWSQDLIAALELPRDLFPEIRDGTAVAGRLTWDAASALGLLDGTSVVVGGPDGTVGGMGGGMVEPGIAVNVMGTTDVIFACADQPCFDPDRRLVLNRFPVGEAWCVGGPMAATGGAVAWLAGVLGADLPTLTAEAAAIAAGSDGLIFSPMLAGSRTPRWDVTERGGLTRLSFEHGRGHLFRAALEGVAVEVAEVFDALAAAGMPVREIRAVGGGAESSLWLEIRAALLGKPLIVPEVAEASALGAAMLAAVGVGLHADLRAASAAMVRIREKIEPAPDAIAAYAHLKKQYLAYRQHLDRLPVQEAGDL
ncbi:FGGY family carbohydrate kinase [Bradyrhizobium sp. 31Argb]|uniref:xylulokinase n=1 Tax=unclassified Bradyrhizobium TaxID=2631580 RepID=UPI0013EE5602|nr:FGGY family carbohydrate kinase [Bradyrhizobium sp. Leo170]